ncbi:glycosyltransferase family 39 protein [Hymenobacter sp. GOD-10R]|uniref:glycosyltransferase family 39 protein n=1 Tax=Hymenobacter sp. GOD-10R TaxID=3093922 RepID=UPI002D77C6AB|nr:glycosyltransferase family 39 protein [Hymenobacter sp. GOD-10R]WRQ29497.1 glycosyltransferase family 39 protein [Hymenobacter sp. GOD-10R]
MLLPTTQRSLTATDYRWIWLARIVLATGLLVRVVVWWQQRSINLDEANLIRNFVERSYGELFEDLSYEQYAPPLFSALVKASITMLGNEELTVRLVPLLSGMLMLILFYRLAHRWLAPLAAVLALAFVAFDKIFLDYATECKQYATDGAVALILLELVHTVGHQFSNRQAVLWAVLGMVAVWLSMPAVFVLAGIGFFMLTRYIQQKNTSAIIRVVLVGVLWGVSFLVYFILLLRQNAQSDYLQNFHREHFLAFPPLNEDEFKLLLRQLNELVDKSIGKTAIASVLAVIGVGIGIRELIHQRRAEAWLLLAPIIFCLMASALRYYSLIPRLTLFFLPLLIILIFIGLDKLFTNQWARYPFLLGIIVTLLNQQHLYNLWRPFEGDYAEVSQGLSFIAQEQQPNEAVFVYHNSAPIARYYTQHHKQSLVLTNLILQRFRNSPTDIVTEDVRAILQHGTRRIWLLYDRPDSTMADLARTVGTIRKRKNYFRGYVLLCEAK